MSNRKAQALAQFIARGPETPEQGFGLGWDAAMEAPRTPEELAEHNDRWWQAACAPVVIVNVATAPGALTEDLANHLAEMGTQLRAIMADKLVAEAKKRGRL